VLVEDGVFRQFLFDSYYARRTGRRTTGSAARTGDAITIGTGNVIWEPGESEPQAVLRGISDGLYITDMMGFGFNPTTGDVSKGAAGVWIENGELAYPVVEVNVSGNLKSMLQGIEAVCNDQQWHAGIAAPTILISRAMVSGL
jgi:PmbA protein